MLTWVESVNCVLPLMVGEVSDEFCEPPPDGVSEPVPLDDDEPVIEQW